MSLLRHFRAHVQVMDYGHTAHLWLFRENEHGSTTDLVMPVQLITQHEPDIAAERGPTLELPAQLLGSIVESAIAAGIHPKGYVAGDAAFRAQRAHLEDLREIVFKQLKIRTPT